MSIRKDSNGKSEAPDESKDRSNTLNLKDMTSISKIKSLPPSIVVDLDSSDSDTVESYYKENSLEEQLESSENAEGQEKLLKKLTENNDRYRFVKFVVNERNAKVEQEMQNDFKNRVSFDTVNIDGDKANEGADDMIQAPRKQSAFEFDEELFNINRGRDRNRSPSPASPRMLSPLRGVSPSAFGNNFLDISMYRPPVRTDYPTKPLVTHKGCTYGKFHKDFKDLYLGKLNNKSHNFRKPALPRRVILVYINGRKHTWVALDWIMNEFIEDGDSVVIVSSIKPEALKDSKYAPNMVGYSSAVDLTHKSLKRRLDYRSRKPYIRVLSKRIMEYALKVKKPKVIVKVTVDISIGNTKDVLQDMYRLYMPNLVCTGTKHNTRISAPLRSWISSKLTDRLVKNFPLPVIAVPAMNMCDFESRLEEFVSTGAPEKEDAEANCKIVGEAPSASEMSVTSSTMSLSHDPSCGIEDMSSSDNDDASINSSGSQSSYESYDEIEKAYLTFKDTVEMKLHCAKHHKMNESYFANMLKIISDESMTFCQEIMAINPGFRGDGAKLARAVTGSNTFGTVPYKTKSLLTPEKPDEIVSTTNSGLTYKELKKVLKEKKRQEEVPSIKVEAQDSVSPPPKSRSSSLKFVEMEGPSSSGERKLKGFHHRSLSHDPELRNPRPAIEPMKSHPDMKTPVSLRSKDSSNSTKKPKKKFLGLF